MRVLRYVGRRLFLLLPVLLGVVFITFALTRLLPGNPIDVVAGPYVSEERRAEMKREARLDLPFYTQFALYLKDMARGDLGTSYTTAQPVIADLGERFPATLEVVTLGMVIGLLLAIPLGVLSAVARDTMVDHAIRVVTIGFVSVPIFWLALVALQFFYFKLDLVPAPMGRLPIMLSEPPRVTGMYLVDALLVGDMALFWAAAKQLLMPVFLMAVSVAAPIIRMTRTAMLEALESDYIRCARSLGLSRSRITFQHALKNALIPVLTTIAAVYGFALGGSVLLEMVFAWPGLGSYAYEAITRADFPAVQGFIMLVTVQYVLVYLVLDVLIAAIDPRVEL